MLPATNLKQRLSQHHPPFYMKILFPHIETTLLANSSGIYPRPGCRTMFRLRKAAERRNQGVFIKVIIIQLVSIE